MPRDRSAPPRPLRALGLAGAGVLLGLACADAPSSSPAGCLAPLGTVLRGDALMAHLEALADVAEASAGSRAAGLAGHTGSAAYVEARLAEAGYAVRRHTFDFLDYELLAPPRLAQLAPSASEYVDGEDYRVARFSAAGDVSAPVSLVDLSLESGSKSTSGCQADDFVGFPIGHIALIQRGGCAFADKVENAALAGASAVVMVNQGDSEARMAAFSPRLWPGAPLPVVGASFPLGVALAEVAGLELRITVDGREVTRETDNLIAETPKTESGAVIMLGAHLDSVIAGPGINDNGSGVAAVLEVARALAGCELRHQVRVAFWGAEELGLLGSDAYVASLTADELAAIALYLNLDMVASPNPVRFLYDGDGSAFGVPGPAGSEVIEAALARVYAEQALPTRETPFDGRSDYGPFIAQGIAAGGIFTGAEGIMSDDEAAVFGGHAGLAYDRCYHQECDGRDNVDGATLLESARAAAQVIEGFAMAEEPPGTGAEPRARARFEPPEAGLGPTIHGCDDAPER